MFSLKLPTLPVKPRKSNKKTSKVYRAKEVNLELETLTNTLDLENKKIKTCCFFKNVLSKASLFT